MNAERLIGKLGIGHEHKGKVEEIQKYIVENRVNELFNVCIISFSFRLAYWLSNIGDLD